MFAFACVCACVCARGVRTCACVCARGMCTQVNVCVGVECVLGECTCECLRASVFVYRRACVLVCDAHCACVGALAYAYIVVCWSTRVTHSVRVRAYA